MTFTTSLLREWDLLQKQVMPALLDVAPSRPPQVWTVGHAQDAVALAVAYHHAWGDSESADISVFLPGPAGGPERVHFGLADIRCLPTDRRSQAFVRQEHHYVPSPLLMGRVILAVPAQPVDLVSIRARSQEEDRPGRRPQARGTAFCQARAAMGRLRRGGHVLFAEPPPEGLLTAGQFRPLGGSGRLFEKLTEPSEPERPANGGPRCAATLASREEQARLVESHFNLARSLARRFAHHGELADDLEQVALLALVKAAGRYSSDHGSSFATFATASVLGELKRHFRDKTWMLRVPRSLQETYLAVKTAREELGQTLRTSPTVQQIAAHLRITEEAVLSAMEAGDSYWPASLDAPRRGEEDLVTEVPVIDAEFDVSLDRRQLRESLPKLDERERLIIKRLYFDGCTQRRVAEEIGVSQMQVSRLMARSLDKLRGYFGQA
ncbi:MAG TPA: sigma-70 family RNA polymerase sigma factor [Acidimicrobiales bacterium]|nr:sigma-70 family RNA polymerase sigma factor [Acidimicrobiales bacterium]